jgi:hypothetical protein
MNLVVYAPNQAIGSKEGKKEFGKAEDSSPLFFTSNESAPQA